ncbi:MAG TPA: hypothetical protein DCQ31_06535 [Bacteroidales bacterium]|nr:hypothetical protein [Bacteroidales bacterium]
MSNLYQAIRNTYKIIILEQDIELFHFAVEVFGEELQAYEFVLANSCDEAISMSISLLPKLILVHNNFSSENAIDMIKRLKYVDILRDVPILIVSSPRDYAKAYEAGAIDFIRRPVDKTELVVRVKSMLSLFTLLNGMKEASEFLEMQASDLERKSKEVEEEKKRTDALLLNILPYEIAEQLKNKGSVEAKRYRRVSVMFIDFKGFTKLSEMLTFQEIIKELGICFEKFDEIVGLHFVEKIKTIGDAYMCAGGLPIRNASNPIDTLLAALKINKFIDEYNDLKRSLDQPLWEIRTGIHTGEVIAGVIGKKKFAYDIWGDTVNTAARVQSASEPGKINISGITYDFVKEYFNCTYRGKVAAKNKGEIDMYFVQGLKPEFASDVDGIQPNSKFKEILSTF